MVNSKIQTQRGYDCVRISGGMTPIVVEYVRLDNDLAIVRTENNVTCIAEIHPWIWKAKEETEIYHRDEWDAIRAFQYIRLVHSKE